MRLPTSPSAYLIPIYLLPALSSAISIDCDRVKVDGSEFSFSKLSGPKTVSQMQDAYPSIVNRTFTVDLCKPLLRDPSTPKEEGCRSGTHVCGIETFTNADNLTVTGLNVIPIAGAYETSTGGSLSPHWTRLKSSDSTEAHEGLRLRVHGGRAGGRKQHAVIELLCTRETERRDGRKEEVVRKDGDGDGGDDEDNGDGDEDNGDGDEDDGDGTPDNQKEWQDLLTTDDGEGGTLQFLSYEREKSEGVLRLKWKTKYACEDAMDHDDEPSSGGWGFFSWFFLIIFMALLAYLAASCYINYTRYGARGVDLLPHGDTLLDLPYIIRDFFRKIVQTFQGGGSRGGYSAV